LVDVLESVVPLTYDWTLSLAAHPRALWALAFVAFIESSVFPIPPDVLMIAMIIAAIVVTATIARPPPRGVGRAWLLRELG
jgi:hypothetical protein